MCSENAIPQCIYLNICICAAVFVYTFPQLGGLLYKRYCLLAPYCGGNEIINNKKTVIQNTTISRHYDGIYPISAMSRLYMEVIGTPNRHRQLVVLKISNSHLCFPQFLQLKFVCQQLYIYVIFSPYHHKAFWDCEYIVCTNKKCDYPLSEPGLIDRSIVFVRLRIADVKTSGENKHMSRTHINHHPARSISFDFAQRIYVYWERIANDFRTNDDEDDDDDDELVCWGHTQNTESIAWRGTTLVCKGTGRNGNTRRPNAVRADRRPIKIKMFLFQIVCTEIAYVTLFFEWWLASNQAAAHQLYRHV